MRALVTGATGFIGCHLTDELLRHGVTVRALVHTTDIRTNIAEQVERFLGDVRDLEAVKAAVVGCDIVFHLAAKAHALSERRQNESEYYAVNVDGTRNLLEAASALPGCKVVFFSSVKVMGEGGVECLDESVEPRPSTEYGRSKLAAERLVVAYGKRSGASATCLRLPLVYGPGNKGNLFQMIAAIDRGFFPPIPNVRNRRSMVHVSNVVIAAILVANSPSANGECYIVKDGKDYSTRDLYEGICHQLGRGLPRWQTPLWLLKAVAGVGEIIGLIRGRRVLFDCDAMEKLLGSAWYSSEKISRELGYRPPVCFEDSLPELIAWYRKSQA